MTYDPRTPDASGTHESPPDAWFPSAEAIKVFLRATGPARQARPDAFRPRATFAPPLRRTTRPLLAWPRRLRHRCPGCGSSRHVRIVYGLPAPSARAAAARGEIVLAGCMVPEYPRHHGCRECGSDFNFLEDVLPRRPYVDWRPVRVTEMVRDPATGRYRTRTYVRRLPRVRWDNLLRARPRWR